MACPKNWMTDRSSNWIRTLLEVQNSWTPIYTFSSDWMASIGGRPHKTDIEQTITVQLT